MEENHYISVKFIFFESDEEKYLKYFEEDIKICFIEIFKNLRQDDHLKEFNDSVKFIKLFNFFRF